jgi:tetratricopeptide (TPR) repeat protein
LNNLLRILNRIGKTEAIRPLAAERIAHLARAAERPDAPALALQAYAWELLNCEVQDLRDPESALPFAKRAVDKRAEELAGGRDAGTLETLAQAYYMTKDLDQAIETQRLAIAETRVGALRDRVKMEARLRDYLLESGNLVDAFNVSWEGLTTGLGEWFLPEGVLPSRAGPEDAAHDASLIRQSETLMEEERFIEAEEVLRGCLAMRRKSLPGGHWLIADARSRLGSAIAADGRFVEAEPLLLEACKALSEDTQVAADVKRRAIERVIRLFTSWDKPDQASEWRQRLEEETGSGAGAGGD